MYRPQVRKTLNAVLDERSSLNLHHRRVSAFLKLSLRGCQRGAANGRQQVASRRRDLQRWSNHSQASPLSFGELHLKLRGARSGGIGEIRNASDTFHFLRHIMRAVWSVRPKCSHRCVSRKETSLKPAQILMHASKNSTEQTAMRTKCFKHIAI